MSLSPEEVVLRMMTYSINMKVYHWQTTNYARHKASDDLVDSLNSHIDRFVEAMQGRFGERLKFWSKSKIEIENYTNPEGKQLLENLCQFLNEELTAFCKGKADLANIKDEMLAECNKSKYLFSLS